ncbi:MAG: hypothetical protein IJI37_00935, partial [Opitutales bacterium]|nr:hypothetical protein [Opitutales bacterium]
AESAGAFFADSPNLAREAKKYLETAESEYLKDSPETASYAMCVSKYLSALGAAKDKASPAVKAKILSSPAFLKEFVSTLSPKDNIPAVFDILSKIEKSSPEKFDKYINLAAAIAVVFDAPPPESWPHGQVDTKLLPRVFPDPAKAFSDIVSARERGKFLMPTEKLSIEEAKYMAASVAADEDKQWAQKSVSVNIPNIAKLYPSIQYDHARLNAKQFEWNGPDYRLKTIKARGGICVDQAYFTAECAKARGVPAFIFSGAGSDGFHAWTAYMLRPGMWNFDVGRYEGARFVTGETIDPQTWEKATDHNLNAMREGFRNGAKYALSEIHAGFAKHFLSKGDAAKAEAAARKSVAADPRNADAWQTMVSAMKKSEKPAKELAKVYEAAIKSFSKYPDIDAEFRREYMAMLSETGNAAAARKLSTSIILKTKSQRPDIAMEFARRELESDIADGAADKIISSYKRLLTPFKNDAAIAIDGLTVPILNSLLKSGNADCCREIMKATRQTFKSAKDASLKSTLDSLDQQIQNIADKKSN